MKWISRWLPHRRLSSSIIKQGPATRVVYFYPGEEGTFVENAHVTLFTNGIVHVTSETEETTTHLQNCEILWRVQEPGDLMEMSPASVRPLGPRLVKRPTQD